MTTPYRIITVCTGNICRSPMAEFMLADAAAEAGLDMVVDSAGTSAWETGNPIDPRAKAVLACHGIAAVEHAARKFNPAWFGERELILALDTDHEVAHAQPRQQGIYDPWFGTSKDFDVSWDLISAAIPGILAHARG